ncbi:MAG: SPOR domain-containing protein [Bacteroidota bacterium]
MDNLNLLIILLLAGIIIGMLMGNKMSNNNQLPMSQRQWQDPTFLNPRYHNRDSNAFMYFLIFVTLIIGLLVAFSRWTNFQNIGLDDNLPLQKVSLAKKQTPKDIPFIPFSQELDSAEESSLFSNIMHGPKYYIQIGAFKDYRNAAHAYNNYKGQFINLQLEPYENLFKLLIGPFEEKSLAKRYQKELSINSHIIEW